MQKIREEDVVIRLGVASDEKYLVEWLLQPGVLEGFPLSDTREIEDAAKIWLSYARFGAVLTALYKGEPVGVANLYLQSYQKLKHQCLFAIIVDEKIRGKGVGKKLLQELMTLAKEKFSIEILHLEVYETNMPAIQLYEKFGFSKYGRQKHFMKEPDRYLAKVLMQKVL